MQEATTDSASPHPHSLSFRLPAAAWLAAGTILVLGAALRICGARGELWLDEIWSLKLIQKAETEYGFLWGLTIDNNHYLNTLYLYLIGPDAPAIVLRSLSILLGVLSIAAAGFAMRRSGAPAMLAAMTLFAVTYPMVNYGSEARGYSGMILTTVLAIILVEAAFSKAWRGAPIMLGIAAAAGFLFQPVSALGLAILGIWTLWMSWHTTGSLRQTERTALRVFMPAAILLLAIIGFILFAIVKTGGYQFGGTKPFSMAGFLIGFGGMLRFLLGLPDQVPDGFAIVVALAAVGLGLLWRRHLIAGRSSLAVIGLIVAPAAIFALRPPNVEYPRYYLPSGIIFVLLLADLFAVAWRAGGWQRMMASVLALISLIGTGLLLQKAYEHGRGNVVDALRIIAADRNPLVTSNNDNQDQSVVEYFANRLQIPVRYIPLKELCRERPSWLLTSQYGDTPEVAEMALPDCKILFRRQTVFPAWGLSGSPWTLYRVTE